MENLLRARNSHPPSACPRQRIYGDTFDRSRIYCTYLYISPGSPACNGA